MWSTDLIVFPSRENQAGSVTRYSVLQPNGEFEQIGGHLRAVIDVYLSYLVNSRAARGGGRGPAGPHARQTYGEKNLFVGLSDPETFCTSSLHR